MNVLVLSISAGGGHMKTAESIKNYINLNEENSTVQIIDAYKYMNPVLEKFLIGGYIKTIKKSPALFGKLYNHTEIDNTLSTVSSKINEILSYRLYPVIKDINPDIIVSTHPFPNEMISILKKDSKLSIPCISILTDYSPHNFWLRSGIDAYVVSNKDMVDEMILRGINKDIIFDLGIPTSPEFKTKYNKADTLKEINLYENKNTILIMGGSLGLGNIEDIYLDLCKTTNDIQIIVIAGNNKKLYNNLLDLSVSSPKPTKIIGYTKEVNKYMQCSDILLTKPGGITITEALICTTPMILFSPIPGQEEKNSEFLTKHNLAISLNDFKNTQDAINYILSSHSKLETMKKNCSCYSKIDAGNNIYKLIRKIINAKK